MEQVTMEPIDMRIGALARHSGIRVETIRYYEQRGLLVPPHRTQGGHRNYEAADLERLSAVRALSRLGLSLDEVRDFLESTGQPQTDPGFLDRLASNATAYARQAKVLTGLLERCRRGAGKAEVLAILASDAARNDEDDKT